MMFLTHSSGKETANVRGTNCQYVMTSRMGTLQSLPTDGQVIRGEQTISYLGMSSL